MIEIAQTRPSLYDQHVDRSLPLVPRELRFEVGGRLDGTGSEVEPFDGRVPEIGDVDAVAVCLLHSDLESAHERAVAQVLLARGLDVVCSHEVSPEFREYERMVTTVADAAPARFVVRTPRSGGVREVLVMTSAGGACRSRTRRARLRPLSGPVAGVRAAAAVAGAWFSRRGVVRHGRYQHGRVSSAAVRPNPRRPPSPDTPPGSGARAHDRQEEARIAARQWRRRGRPRVRARPGPACYGRGGGSRP